MTYSILSIPNERNNCYISSLIQCMRRSLYGIDTIDSYVKNIVHNIDGNMHDPHEMYMNLLTSVLPERIASYYKIEYDDGTSLPYIPIGHYNARNMANITSYPKIICIYQMVMDCMLDKVSHLTIDNKYYLLSGCICYVNDNHYYSVVRERNDYIKCDGEDIAYIENDSIHQIYMLFYNQI
jgi:hypothetical protein